MKNVSFFISAMKLVFDVLPLNKNKVAVKHFLKVPFYRDLKKNK